MVTYVALSPNAKMTDGPAEASRESAMMLTEDIQDATYSGYLRQSGYVDEALTYRYISIAEAIIVTDCTCGDTP